MSKTHNNTFITRCYYVISFGPILYQHNLTSGDNSNTINVFFLNHLSASNIGQKGFIFTDLLPVGGIKKHQILAEHFDNKEVPQCWVEFKCPSGTAHRTSCDYGF